MIFKVIKKAVTGVFKGVKKLVKGVGKAFKKLAPVLVVAGALYFGGVGMGWITNGMSWSQAAATMASKLGLTGVGASAVSTGIQYAGYGGLAGAATSLLTGEDVWKGFTKGALAGGVTGAVGGATGLLTPPSALPPTGVGGAGTGGAMASSGGPVPGAGLDTGGLSPGALGGKLDPTQMAAAQSGASGAASGLGKIGDAIKNITPAQAAFFGPVVGGAAKGIGNYLSQKEQAKAEEERRQDLVASYEGSGAEIAPVGDVAGGVPRSRGGGGGQGKFRYDPKTGDYKYLADYTTGMPRPISQWSKA